MKRRLLAPLLAFALLIPVSAAVVTVPDAEPAEAASCHRQSTKYYANASFSTKAMGSWCYSFFTITCKNTWHSVYKTGTHSSYYGWTTSWLVCPSGYWVTNWSIARY